MKNRNEVVNNKQIVSAGAEKGFLRKWTCSGVVKGEKLYISIAEARGSFGQPFSSHRPWTYLLN